jgi:hypothetical protein
MALPVTSAARKSVGTETAFTLTFKAPLLVHGSDPILSRGWPMFHWMGGGQREKRRGRHSGDWPKMGHDAASRVMPRSRSWPRLLGFVLITLLAGCERKPRAREREALEAQARERVRAAEAARRAAEPLPEEPPVETLRVPNSGLPCKVDDVFAAKCRRCHTIPTRHNAPLVFLTWDDTRQDRMGQPLFTIIGRAVRTNFMPYRIEANPPVLQLTDDEKKIIMDWVDAGAPREDCDPNAPEGKKAATAQTKSAPSAAKSAPIASARPKR